MKHKITNQLSPLVLPLLLASLYIHCNCGKEPTNTNSSKTVYDGSKYDPLQNDPAEIKKGGNKGINNLSNYPLLLLAVKEGKVDEVKKLLSSGSDINELNPGNKEETALHIATENGDIPMMQILLQDPKINVGLTNISKKTPLDIALDKDNPAAVKLLIAAAKIDPKTPLDSFGNNLFHRAVQLRKKAVTDALLADDPGLINVPNDEGHSCLHLALANNNKDLSIELMNQGFDVNAVSKDGETPLHCLMDAQPIDMEVLELLLAKGADVDKKDNRDETPLHNLLSWKYIPSKLEILKKLLSKVKDINAQDKKGNTFLHLAVITPRKPLVEALLDDNQININIKDAKARTPLALAEEGIANTKKEDTKKELTEIKELILNAGGKI